MTVEPFSTGVSSPSSVLTSSPSTYTLTNGARSPSSTSWCRSAGKRLSRSSSSSRTLPPSAGTSRAPPTSPRSWVGSGSGSCVRRPPAAELDIVHVLGDGGAVATDRAVRVAAKIDLAELGRQRVEEEQPPDQRLADPEAELQRLARLERADDARQDTEHAALCAAGRELRGRRLREQTAVARPLMRLEHGRLPLEPVDRAVHQRNVVPDRGVVDQVSGREVVGAVDDHVPPVGEDPLDVLGREPLDIGDDLDVRVELLERPLRRLRLPLAESPGRMHDLALEVRGIDAVVVDDPEPADARRGEV